MRKRIVVSLVVAAGALMLQTPALAADQSHANPSSNQTQNQNSPKKHTVAAGESLSTIATDNGLGSWMPIWDANADLQDPDHIDPGQQLVIPDPSQQLPDRPLPSGYGHPASAPVSASTVSYRSNMPAHHSAAPASADLFGRIRARESGGNYAENTGNGYYGAYQYNDSTWGGYGGYKHASDAPPAVQDAKAAQTYAARGCSPWPNTCY
jgi:LysM repeat protein